jgi:hypothetical protein
MPTASQDRYGRNWTLPGLDLRPLCPPRRSQSLRRLSYRFNAASHVIGRISAQSKVQGHHRVHVLKCVDCRRALQSRHEPVLQQADQMQNL